jgi:hypothetical protein
LPSQVWLLKTIAILILNTILVTVYLLFQFLKIIKNKIQDLCFFGQHDALLLYLHFADKIIKMVVFVMVYHLNKRGFN